MPDRPFTVELTRDAEKDLKRLRPWADKAARAIVGLERDPNLGHPLSGRLKGTRSLEFSLPGGAYRAVYAVLEEQNVCLVFIVGAHEGIYEKAERRLTALRRSGEI